MSSAWARGARARRAHKPSVQSTLTKSAKQEATSRSVRITLCPLPYPLSDTTHSDYEYYLSQQILPPIERLCEPIEGTDRARLAQCLGTPPHAFLPLPADSPRRTGPEQVPQHDRRRVRGPPLRLARLAHVRHRALQGRGAVRRALPRVRRARRVRAARGPRGTSPFPSTHRPPTLTTAHTELAADVRGRGVPELPRAARRGERAGAARGADPRARRAVLRGLDGVRRPDVRAPHAHDGRVRPAVPAPGVPGHGRVRGASLPIPLSRRGVRSG